MIGRVHVVWPAVLAFALGPWAASTASPRNLGGLREDDTLMTSVSDDAIVVTLDIQHVKHRKTGKGEFVLEVAGRKIGLTNYQKDCLFYVGFDRDGKGNLAAVNRWNSREVGATRAYLDEDGDPCLEMDVDVEGGMSPFAFSLHFGQYFHAVERFAKEVVGEAAE